MDHFQQAIVMMAIIDTRWGPRDADGRRRELTTAELDALVDFDWPWAGMKGRLAPFANAMLSRLRPRTSSRINPTPLPSAEATARV